MAPANQKLLNYRANNSIDDTIDFEETTAIRNAKKHGAETFPINIDNLFATLESLAAERDFLIAELDTTLDKLNAIRDIIKDY